MSLNNEEYLALVSVVDYYLDDEEEILHLKKTLQECNKLINDTILIKKIYKKEKDNEPISANT